MWSLDDGPFKQLQYSAPCSSFVMGFWGKRVFVETLSLVIILLQVISVSLF